MTAADHDAELAVLRTMAAEWRRREDEAAADLAWLQARLPHEVPA